MQDATTSRMSPTVNQEVVATLLEVLLTHEEVNAAIEHALVRRGQLPSSDVESHDLQASIDSAALLEARMMAVEWTQISLLALAGSQVFASTRLACAISSQLVWCHSWLTSPFTAGQGRGHQSAFFCL
jgi:hypothetical protein